MTFPYLLKLLCLCLASFSLIHLALATLISLATPAAMRIAGQMRSSSAARLLFVLRVLPAGLGGFIVAGLCIPSYLRLEPKTATSEEVGLLCLGFAILGLALSVGSFIRGLRAIARSAQYLRHCQRVGRKTDLPGELSPVWMLEEPTALFAIGGIIHPRLLISRQVMNLLSGDQLTAALRHEQAHWISRDNLKRLLLTLAPDTLPFLNGFASLERGWARYMERAADDRATGGEVERSLSLATALVRVSRLGIAPRPSPLTAPLLADDEDLAARVERLLNPAPLAESHTPWMGCLVAGVAVMLAAGLFTLPALLYPVHRFLEHLI
jgi:Zn-dependent protease with chaperone function